MFIASAPGLGSTFLLSTKKHNFYKPLFYEKYDIAASYFNIFVCKTVYYTILY